MYQALLILLTASLGDVLNRFILSNKKIEWKIFVNVSYFYYAILLIPIMFLWGKYNDINLSYSLIGLFLLSIFFCMGYSIFRNIGFKYLNIATIEPLLLSQRAFSIFFAALFFIDERNIIDIVLGILVIITILIGNLDIRNFKIKKSSYIWYPILGSLLGAMNSVIAKSLLVEFDPISLACLRALGISVLLYIWIRPKITDFTNNSKYYSILGINDALGVVLILWAYQEIGIILTSMVLTTAPLTAQIVSKIILKEYFDIKKIITTIVAIGLIILSILY